MRRKTLISETHEGGKYPWPRKGSGFEKRAGLKVAMRMAMQRHKEIMFAKKKSQLQKTLPN